MINSSWYLAPLVFCFFVLTSYQNVEDESVQIGEQIWKSRNLNVSTFRNGDEILHAKTDEAWRNAAQNQQPAWRYMNNDSTLAENYGKMYNWFAVADERGLAPESWKIPSEEDWKQLVDYLGPDAGQLMKHTSKYIRHGSGNNESGFSGLFGGICFFNGQFSNYRVSGSYWSSTESSDGQAWTLQLSANSPEAKLLPAYKTFGVSVRCFKEA